MAPDSPSLMPWTALASSDAPMLRSTSAMSVSRAVTESLSISPLPGWLASFRASRIRNSRLRSELCMDRAEDALPIAADEMREVADVYRIVGLVALPDGLDHPVAEVVRHGAVAPAPKVAHDERPHGVAVDVERPNHGVFVWPCDGDHWGATP